MIVACVSWEFASKKNLVEDQVYSITKCSENTPYIIKENKKGYIIPIPSKDFTSVGMWYDRENSTPDNPIFLPIEERRKSEEELEKEYHDLTLKYIREKYSDTDEYKVLREAIAYPEDETIQSNFNIYNEYVVECKTRAYNEVYK